MSLTVALPLAAGDMKLPRPPLADCLAGDAERGGYLNVTGALRAKAVHGIRPSLLNSRAERRKVRQALRILAGDPSTRRPDQPFGSLRDVTGFSGGASAHTTDPMTTAGCHARGLSDGS